MYCTPQKTVTTVRRMKSNLANWQSGDQNWSLDAAFLFIGRKEKKVTGGTISGLPTRPPNGRTKTDGLLEGRKLRTFQDRRFGLINRVDPFIGPLIQLPDFLAMFPNDSGLSDQSLVLNTVTVKFFPKQTDLIKCKLHLSLHGMYGRSLDSNLERRLKPSSKPHLGRDFIERIRGVKRVDSSLAIASSCAVTTNEIAQLFANFEM